MHSVTTTLAHPVRIKGDVGAVSLLFSMFMLHLHILLTLWVVGVFTGAWAVMVYYFIDYRHLIFWH